MSPSPHRNQGWSAESSLVRPYSLTGGRTRPTRTDLAPNTLVVAVPSVDPTELDPELETILSLCVRPMSVAEVSARSGFAPGVLRVLLSDLADQGRVMVHSSGQEGHRPDADTLRSVLARIKEM